MRQWNCISILRHLYFLSFFLMFVTSRNLLFLGLFHRYSVQQSKQASISIVSFWMITFLALHLSSEAFQKQFIWCGHYLDPHPHPPPIYSSSVTRCSKLLWNVQASVAYSNGKAQSPSSDFFRTEPSLVLVQAVKLCDEIIICLRIKLDQM